MTERERGGPISNLGPGDPHSLILTSPSCSPCIPPTKTRIARPQRGREKERRQSGGRLSSEKAPTNTDPRWPSSWLGFVVGNVDHGDHSL